MIKIRDVYESHNPSKLSHESIRLNIKKLAESKQYVNLIDKTNTWYIDKSLIHKVTGRKKYPNHYDKLCRADKIKLHTMGIKKDDNLLMESIVKYSNLLLGEPWDYFYTIKPKCNRRFEIEEFYKHLDECFKSITFEDKTLTVSTFIAVEKGATKGLTHAHLLVRPFSFRSLNAFRTPSVLLMRMIKNWFTQNFGIELDIEDLDYEFEKMQRSKNNQLCDELYILKDYWIAPKAYGYNHYY